MAEDWFLDASYKFINEYIKAIKTDRRHKRLDLARLYGELGLVLFHQDLGRVNHLDPFLLTELDFRATTQFLLKMREWRKMLKTRKTIVFDELIQLELLKYGVKDVNAMETPMEMHYEEIGTPGGGANERERNNRERVSTE